MKEEKLKRYNLIEFICYIVLVLTLYIGVIFAVYTYVEKSKSVAEIESVGSTENIETILESNTQGILKELYIEPTTNKDKLIVVVKVGEQDITLLVSGEMYEFIRNNYKVGDVIPIERVNNRYEPLSSKELTLDLESKGIEVWK